MKPLTPTELIAAINNMKENDGRIIFDIFTSFNSYIQKHSFKDIEEILEKVDPSKVPAQVSLTLLTATHICKDKIKNRDKFHEKATEHFSVVFKDEPACLPLLSKLK